jgi:hypothetical protein
MSPRGPRPRRGGLNMRPRLLRLALTAALLVVGAGISHALAPDDAIYLSQEGVDPEIIIAKICADAEAWDLTAEEIVYLAEEGVSLDVINALIDPVSAAEKWGFTLGEPDVYIQEGEETYAEEGYYPDDGYYIEESGGSSLIFSLGYYNGPLAVHYFSHPYFYPYMYTNGFSFGYSYWPVYYRSYYYPWSCGYYPYPYYAYGEGSYYYGDAYIGYYQHNYYGDRGTRVHEIGDVAYRGWSDERERKAAWRSDKPPNPEIRDGNGGDPGKEQLADGYRSRNDGGRGSRGFDPMPGDRRIGSEGTLNTGGPIGDVARVDGRTSGGTRRGGDIASVVPAKSTEGRRSGERGSLSSGLPSQSTKRVSDIGGRRTVGTPKKIELPNGRRSIDRTTSKNPGRRKVSLGTTRTNKSSLGRKLESSAKKSTNSRRKITSPKQNTVSTGSKSSGSKSSSNRILKPSRSTSTKIAKPTKSSSSKSSPKISKSSGSKKSLSSKKVSRSGGSSSKKAPSVKSSRSSSKSSAKRSSGSLGGRR